jgi:hypothetical protein
VAAGDVSDDLSEQLEFGGAGSMIRIHFSASGKE